jgi:hypothetical protein
MLKLDFLKRLGLAVFGVPVALAAGASPASAAAAGSDPLSGIWDANVVSKESFAGSGKFTQFDLHGKAAYTESYTLNAKRVSV